MNDRLLLAYREALRQDEPAPLYVEEGLFNLSIRYIGGFPSARLSIGQADFLTKIVKHRSLRDRLCRMLNFLEVKSLLRRSGSDTAVGLAVTLPIIRLRNGPVLTLAHASHYFFRICGVVMCGRLPKGRSVRRREFITLVGGAIAWPLAAQAQEPKVPTIGILVRAVPGFEEFRRLFPVELRDLGYIDGKNIHFEFRSDDGQIKRLPELAAELVRLKVDVIVPWLTPAAAAAKQATREIPIVCAACGDPVGSGLVGSLARPGGNVTGISGVAGELAAKIVELIPEVVASAHRIAVLANVPDPFTQSFLKQVQLAGQKTGTSIEPVMINTPEELDAVFPVMEKSRPDAIIVQPSLPTKRAAELALSYRIPAFCAWRSHFPAMAGWRRVCRR